MNFHLMTEAQLYKELERIEDEKDGLSQRYNAGHLASLDDEKRSILNCLNNRR